MVVLGQSYTTSSNFQTLLTDTLTHRRYPSSANPVLKEFENKGTLLDFKDDLAVHGLQHKPSIALRHGRTHRQTGSGSTTGHGRAPTIVSSVVSPTVSRKPSITQKKRFMMSKNELKSKFFYPVNGPKRVRSRRGKYRNKSELDASMSYIDFDTSMSRDLCYNQHTIAYEFDRKQILKPNPPVHGKVKMITVDSQNNYILYTPDPTPGKNSVIADAEMILNQELLKLGKPVAFVNRSSSKVSKLPEYRIIRPEFQRYDTFPITEKPGLIRTNSLPSKFNDEKLEALWNLYLRRVIASRIKWRLTHTSQEYLNEVKKNNRKSMASSVDTGFFMQELLQERVSFPNAYKESPPSQVTGDLYADDIEKRYTSAESIVSSAPESPRRQVMLDSLEQLMAEVTSVMSAM